LQFSTPRAIFSALGRAAASNRGSAPLPKFPVRCLILAFLALAGLGAEYACAQGFQTSVPSAILIDAGTNTVLFEKGAALARGLF
jgi:D-alanyl-D-alanine carboxypeptidase